MQMQLVYAQCDTIVGISLLLRINRMLLSSSSSSVYNTDFFFFFRCYYFFSFLFSSFCILYYVLLCSRPLLQKKDSWNLQNMERWLFICTIFAREDKNWTNFFGCCIRRMVCRLKASVAHQNLSIGRLGMVGTITCLYISALFGSL